MPESLGKTLKKIRDSKNLSIEEVSERSRIPRNIISAVEEDRLDEIKSPFYAKSFVKTYAGFLGALGETAVKGFLGEGLKPFPTSVSSKSPSRVIARHEAPKQSDPKGHSERSEESHLDCFASLAMTL